MWTTKAFGRSATNQGCDAFTFLKRAAATPRERTSRRKNEVAVVHLCQSRAPLAACHLYHGCFRALRPTSTEGIAARKRTVWNGERRSARSGQRCASQADHGGRFR